ncbi:uncharacterized protein LOC123675273 [Harmonia axyridis]|uniref:uncharacterized protein LOC123675273 n=1 Tax=Harmonia axyridis TaxID=115357 RepID=UPI001E2791FB|nr:uncharacterized protein LOC123675273 [Harmonia axyridis]
MDWTILYTNLASLSAKFGDLLLLVEDCKPVFIFITETWLSPEMPDQAFHIPGFSMFRCDSLTTPGHAGSCIYVHDCVADIFSITKYSLPTPGIDNLFLKMVSGNFALFTGCVYRPRPSEHDAIICDHIKTISEREKNVFIVGDFNLGDIREWPVSRLPSANSPSFLFIDMLFNSNLQQLVEKPTRYRANQTPTCPDLIFTNDPDMVSDIRYGPPLGKSDHLVLSTQLQLRIPSLKNNIVGETHKVIDYREVKRALDAVDWDSVLGRGSVDERWKNFFDYICSAIDKNTTFVETVKDKLKPWINNQLLRTIKYKKSLWRRYLRSKSEAIFKQHRQLSNFLSQSIKRAKISYINSLTTSNNKKKFFKFTRQCLNCKVSTPSIRSAEDGDLLSPIETAESFASCFSLAFISEPVGPMPPLTTPRNESSISEIVITHEEVERQLRSLKISSSPGPDNISAKFLSECATSLSVPLPSIFSFSLASGD